MFTNNKRIVDTLNISTSKTLSSWQSEQINLLWNEEYPINLKDRFSLLLDGAAWHNHYIIEDQEKNIIAWAVDFEKDKQVRFSIIVATKYKGLGLGKRLIDKLKEANNEFYGWVIDHNDDVKANGVTYLSPMPFYLKQGFDILQDTRIDNEMIRAVLMQWTGK